jgi:hypothetical protein
MTLRLTQTLREISTRGEGGGKARQAFKADNRTAICELTAYKRGILDVSQSYRTPRPATGTALPLKQQL